MNQIARIRIWLTFVLFLLILMVAVGGWTRLTQSGLSIVEWNLVTGTIPPITESQWRLEFEKYKQFPQYQKINSDMQLEEFKFIFFWEWFHRFLGRLIGVVYFFPLVLFQWRGSLDRKTSFCLWLGFFLGGLQGVLGWWMVKSGLIDNPLVSHFRLAAHLSLAFAILAYLTSVWLYLAGWPTRLRAILRNPAAPLYFAFLVLLVVQIVYGALTAGLRAGHGYNTFPLMNGRWIPVEISAGTWTTDFVLSTKLTVQFIHRYLGLAVGVVGVGLWWFVQVSSVAKVTRCLGNYLLFSILLQVGLGIWTLISVVPVGLGSLHQIGGLNLWLATVVLGWSLGLGRSGMSREQNV